jgi:hypothetical protein
MDIEGWMEWGEETQSDIDDGRTVIPEETTALPSMSKLISCDSI